MGRNRQICGLVLSLIAAAERGPTFAAVREPVQPRRNVEEFKPVKARFIRFVVLATNTSEPCLDELEVYTDDPGAGNVALAEKGARATACGSLPGYAIHRLEGVNDGLYGNGQSWIADRIHGAWVQIELPKAMTINRVVWSRDREGNFHDRLATDYRLEVALSTNDWQVAASAADRQPLTPGAGLSGALTPGQQFIYRVAPVGSAPGRGPQRRRSEYAIDTWQTSDGLPGNTVTALAQTPEGFLWVGTLNGLARFDGLQFKVLRQNEGLPEARILSLLSDREGNLWIGTEGGGLLRRRHGQFDRITTREGLPSDTVSTLAQSSDGSIWIGTRAGLARWRDKVLASEVSGVENASISKLLCGPGDELWCLTDAGLLKKNGNRMTPAAHRDEPSAFTSLFAACLGQSDRLWFGGPNGYIGALTEKKVEIFREPPGQPLGMIWGLLETSNGDVWAGTANSGLRRLRSGQFLELSTEDGLSDNSILSLLEDREGDIWAGTIRGGLMRLKARKLSNFTTADGLAHDAVMSLAEDQSGKLWIGSNGGGLSVRSESGFAPFYANYLIDNEVILSLQAARNGGLWVGTLGGGLFFLQGRQVNYAASALGANHGPVVALCEDGNDGVWVSTRNGGLKHVFQDGATEELKEKAPDGITCISRHARGLWLGTERSGVLHYSDAGVEHYTQAQGLPSDAVRTLCLDSAGALWIGTSGGLGRLADDHLEAFTVSSGLPDPVISQILEDGRGNLWFGCNQGIFRVARKEFDAVAVGRQKHVNAISYGRAEGMETLECTGGFHPAGLRDRAGRLWFSTAKGLVMVDPATLPENRRAPRVVIDEVRLDGKTVSCFEPNSGASGVALGGPLEFKSGSQRLEFRYTALSLQAPERNRFKYRLEGLDAEWIGPTAERNATYTHLSPGKYVFRVIACNNDGKWNEAGAAFRFLVQPQFWQTWWFQAGVGLILVATAASVARLTAVRRLRRSVRHLEELHALEKERTRIARDIHDELGASLTRITLLTELGQKHRNDPDEVATEFGKISATAREAVRAMDAIVWAVNPRNDSLDHFANYISQFAEEFVRPAGIRCRLDLPADLPEHALSTDERHQLFLAVKEALNNVVRHSGASEVWIRLRVEEGEIAITIEDNGRGLVASSATTHTRNGLSNMRERLERLGGHAAMKSAGGGGTTVSLRLPLPAGRREVPA